MYSQSLALAALSAMGVAAVPQMCACPPAAPSVSGQSANVPPSVPGGASNTPFPFGPTAPYGTGAPYPTTASTSTSTITMTTTEQITSTVYASSGSLQAAGAGSATTVTSTCTSTETETITQTVTQTQTVSAPGESGVSNSAPATNSATNIPTNTPQPPIVSGSTTRPSAPYFPTYTNTGGYTYPTGTGTGFGTGTGATAPGGSSTRSRPHGYPHHTHSRSRTAPSGPFGTNPFGSAPFGTAPFGTAPFGTAPAQTGLPTVYPISSFTAPGNSASNSAPGANSTLSLTAPSTYSTNVPTTESSAPGNTASNSAPSASSTLSLTRPSTYETTTPSASAPANSVTNSAPGANSTISSNPYSAYPGTTTTSSSSSSTSVSEVGASTGPASSYTAPSSTYTAPSSTYTAPSSTQTQPSQTSSQPTGQPTGSSQFPQPNISLTNETCFNNGAGNHSTSDSAGASTESAYQCYQGPPSNFPTADKWISYDSMKKIHAKLGQTWCSNGVLNSDDQVNWVFEAIDAVGAASMVDKRVILAQMIQESSGCVNVDATNNGVYNPGLMQSHAGSSFVGNSASDEDQRQSILQMVSDGVQGTRYIGPQGGDGMVQTLDTWGDYFSAARLYNSGSVNEENLSDPLGATAHYCSDSANFLQGWDGVIQGRTDAGCSFA
ncbi:MAG: hypothetical protein Q9162_007255 [Coniocarpon cinnabarinum]